MLESWPGSWGDRIGLVLLFTAYFLLAFVARAWLVKRRTGRAPVVMTSQGRSARAWVTRGFILCGVAAFVYVMTQAVWSDFVARMGELAVLSRPSFWLLGWLLMIASLVLIVVAQAQMGTSWRVGIDDSERVRLITQGLYTRSRNPIFLGMQLMLVGLVFARPTWASVLLCLASSFFIQWQVRLEEAFLASTLGDEYRRFCMKTRRWL